MAALADACRLGIYRPAHRVSAAQRGIRRTVRIREQLVRVRTQTINLLRAQLRQEGMRLPAGAAESVGARLSALDLPSALAEALAPLRDLLSAVAPLIAAGDARVAGHAAADPVVGRLMTVPGIGPITAVTYRATLDTVERFEDAGASTAFLGLVPREASSGTRQRKGAITKAGPGAGAGVAGASRLGSVAPTARPRRAARLGRGRERPPGPSDRDRRLGAPAGPDPLRDLARWDGVSGGPARRPDVKRTAQERRSHQMA